MNNYPACKELPFLLHMVTKRFSAVCCLPFQNVYVANRGDPDQIRLLLKDSGSVVECLTRDRGAAGLSLTDVTVLCPLSKIH